MTQIKQTILLNHIKNQLNKVTHSLMQEIWLVFVLGLLDCFKIYERVLLFHK